MKCTINFSSTTNVERHYRSGTFHRDGAPAVLGHNREQGFEVWYCYGEIHREDGPAIITPRGAKRWFISGEESNNELEHFIKVGEL